MNYEWKKVAHDAGFFHLSLRIHHSSLLITKSREALEKYLLTKLKEVFWEFPADITLTTPFRELNKHADLDLIDFGFVMDIEEDLGIEITEEKAEAFDKQDIAAVVSFIVEELDISQK